MMEELIDIVDEKDNVLDKRTLEEVMDKGLLHRSANIMVFNSKGKLFVHKRSRNLRLYPGLIDIKFGGNVRSGETYEHAAERELFEEANVSHVTLTELFQLRTKRRENNIIRKVFKCIYDGRISLDPSEVEKGGFMSVKKVKRLLKKENLSPSGIDVLKEFFRRNLV